MKEKNTQWTGLSGLMITTLLLLQSYPSWGSDYIVPDTDQSLCYDTLIIIAPPAQGSDFYGQDAQFDGPEPSYLDNGDGTVTDLNTELMWQQGLPPDKMTWEEAADGADTCNIGGYNDWRLPSIKELYSLILFSGTDPSGPDPADPVPFIDTDYFEFEYGDTLSGERLIDAQYWSSTIYQGLTFLNDSTAFGVNFADGRIKGYPSGEHGPPAKSSFMMSFVRYVRGDEYGDNQFVDNGDGSVTDLATGLMWQQTDDGVQRNWVEALEYAEDLVFAGYDDWRLPDAHELQSIVDYTRSMQSTSSPAINPLLSCTQITDEGGDTNFGFYWTGTTHANTMPEFCGTYAVYIAFGEALGWFQQPDSSWVLLDVHGAGAQRSDPKVGDPSQFPHGHGPQGDVIRIFNFVRCVRGTSGTGIEEAVSLDEPFLDVASANPFLDSMTFNYSTPFEGHISLDVYDASGRLVETILSGNVPAGEGSTVWVPEGTNIPFGVYLIRFHTSAGSVTRRVLLLAM